MKRYCKISIKWNCFKYIETFIKIRIFDEFFYEINYCIKLLYTRRWYIREAERIDSRKIKTKTKAGV